MSIRSFKPLFRLAGTSVLAVACATTETPGGDDSGIGGASGTGGAVAPTAGALSSGGAGKAASAGAGGSGVVAGAGQASGGTASGGTTSGGSATAGRAGSSGGTATGGGSSTIALPYTEDFEAPVTMPEWYLNVGEDGVGHGSWATMSDTSGNALRESSRVEESWAVGGDAAWKDQRLEVKVKIPLTDPEEVADVRFRIAVRFSLQQSYYAEFQGNGSVQLGKNASSGGGDLGSEGQASAFAGQAWTTVALEARGNTIAAFVNGAKVAESTDETAPIASGGIALGSSEEVAILYDDVHVTAPQL